MRFWERVQYWDYPARRIAGGSGVCGAWRDLTE